MRYRPGTTVSCLLLLLSLLLLVTTQAGPDQEQEGINSKNPSNWKQLLQQLSSSPSQTLAGYWVTIKNKYLALATAPLSFLSPHKPSTDFRVKSGEEEERGKGDKVKEAAGKSIKKTKETIEESAKSAATMATESADKIKKTISPEDEL